MSNALRRFVARSLGRSIENSLPAQWARGADTASGQLLNAVAWGLAPYVMVYTAALVALLVAVLLK